MTVRLIACGLMIMAAVWVIGWWIPAGFPAAEKSPLTWRQAKIIQVRGAVHGCQNRLGMKKSPIAQRVVTGGPRYRAFVLHKWRQRRDLCHALEQKLSDPTEAIRAVFGRYASQALAVAYCETGGTMSIWARNGQYEHVFQMGLWERRTYGWHVAGDPPIRAARAAFAYFVASGRDWSPWECQP